MDQKQALIPFLKREPLHVLTALSLDAPLVAVAWLAFLQDDLRVQLHFEQAPLLLGLVVWLAYTADRQWDARQSGPDTPNPRHRLQYRLRWPLRVAWGGGIFVTLWLAWTSLPLGVLATGILLAACVMVFLAARQKSTLRHLPWLPKEAQVALVFAAGPAFFVLAQHPGAPAWAVALILGLLVNLFFLNCLLVNAWREGADSSGLAGNPAKWKRAFRLSAHCATGLPPLLILLPGFPGATAVLFVLSALGMLLLNGPSCRLGYLSRHTLANLALLTPAILLILA